MNRQRETLRHIREALGVSFEDMAAALRRLHPEAPFTDRALTRYERHPIHKSNHRLKPEIGYDEVEAAIHAASQPEAPAPPAPTAGRSPLLPAGVADTDAILKRVNLARHEFSTLWMDETVPYGDVLKLGLTDAEVRRLCIDLYLTARKPFDPAKYAALVASSFVMLEEVARDPSLADGKFVDANRGMPKAEIAQRLSAALHNPPRGPNGDEIVPNRAWNNAGEEAKRRAFLEIDRLGLKRETFLLSYQTRHTHDIVERYGWKSNWMLYLVLAALGIPLRNAPPDAEPGDWPDRIDPRPRPEPVAEPVGVAREPDREPVAEPVERVEEAAVVEKLNREPDYAVPAVADALTALRARYRTVSDELVAVREREAELTREYDQLREAIERLDGLRLIYEGAGG